MKRVLHRNAITSADKLVSPVSLVLADVATQGVLEHTTKHYANVAAHNRFGNTPPATKVDITTAADGNNTHGVRLTVPQVVGADGYDLFMSKDAQPKWVGRITESQRLTGGRIFNMGGVIVGDLAAEIATKVRSALTADVDVSGFFTVGGAGVNVTLTAKAKAANDVTMNAAVADDTCVGIVADISSDDTQVGIAPVTQRETATAVGVITVSGNAKVIVTANGMNNSPKTFSIAVTAGDVASVWAGKVRVALAADADVGHAVTGFFDVAGAGAFIILTSKAAAADDGTMNIALFNDSCTGITAAPASAPTTAGVAPVLQIETATVDAGTVLNSDGHIRVTVTANGMTNTPKAILVPVVLADDASAVAGKIRTALTADANVGHAVTGFFTVAGAGANIILTSKLAVADDATMNIAQIDGKSTGVTTAGASAPTTAGVLPVKQIETATVDAATAVASDGHIRVQVVANGMTGSPKKVLVPVVTGDTENEVATAIRAALIADADVGHPATGFFTVAGAAADIILTAKAAAADDGAINVVQTDGKSTGITTEALSVHTLAGSLGTAQIEMATVVAAADITGAGFARIVLTAPGMTGSPITINEYVDVGDTAIEVANAFKAVMALDSRITGFFTIGGISPDIELTAKTIAADDALMNIAVTNASCSGLTDDLTSTTSTPGVAPVPQVETATIVGTVTVAGDADVIVTAVGMAVGVPQTVRFAVDVGDNPTAIAAKARAALALNGTVTAFFNIGAVAGADIVLTAKTAAIDDATMNIASQNAADNGVVPDAFSVHTQAGEAGEYQVETATVIATVTVAGDADAIVTSTTLPGSPLTVRFAVAAGDDASAVAGKARTALNLVSAITTLYTVGGAGADISLTAKSKLADDVALNISTQNSVANGVATVANSVHTLAGNAGTLQQETATAVGAITRAGYAKTVVTAIGMANTPKTVQTLVALNDLAPAWAGKVRTDLTADPDVSAFFTVGGAGADVLLTAKTKAADDVTMNIALSDGDGIGVTEDGSSDNTRAGVLGQVQIETAVIAGAISELGNAKVTVTALGMPNSPKEVAVPLVATTGPGAGKIDVYCLGTGLADNVAPFTVNNAYTPASVASVFCGAGKEKAKVLVKLDVDDLRSLPSLVLSYFFKNDMSAGDWHFKSSQALSLLGAAAQPLEQCFDIDILGNSGLAVLVDSITGQGATASVWIEY